MAQLTQKQFERLANTRSKGRKRFIWLHGVLGWGVFVALFWSCWMAAWKGWEQFLIYLLIALVMFPIGGYFWGASMWNRFERLYEDFLANGSKLDSTKGKELNSQ